MTLFNLIFRRVASLIRSHSDPNRSSWIQLPGKVKGRFNSYAEADAYVEHRRGTSESECDRIKEISGEIKLQELKSSIMRETVKGNVNSKRIFYLMIVFI